MKWLSSLCSGRFTPIGIDVGGASIKAAQLIRVAGGGYELAAACIIPIAPANLEIDVEVAMGVRRALAENHFKGDAIVLGVPNRQVESSVLDLPARTVAPVQMLLRAELHRLHDLPTEGFEMAHWSLPPAMSADPGETAVMAVAARSVDLETMMDVFETVGFEVRAIDVQAWSLARACAGIAPGAGSSAGAGDPGLTAIVNLGFNGGLVVIGDGEGGVLHQRLLPSAGSAALRRAILDRFGLSGEVADDLLREVSMDLWRGQPGESVHAAWTRNMLVRHADKLATEIKRAAVESMQRYPGLRLARVIFCGGGAQGRGMEAYFEARFGGAEVIVARAEKIVPCRETVDAELRESAVLAGAIGLARWGSEG